jgi:DNA glycosylase AlkZ-like
VARPALVGGVIAERLTAQLLAGAPARDPLDVVARLLAVQAQDPRGARLAIRSRSAGLTAADVDRALTEQRALLITWLNRGTLHLVRSEDYWWLHALTTPRLFTASARRLAQEGVTPSEAERGVEVIERALSRDGPLSRAQLRERLRAAGVRTEGQALIHLLLRSALHGTSVRGPVLGGEQAFVLTRDWLGAPPRVKRESALAELARRYLAGHAPADDRDLARWSGLPLRDARAGLQAIASELRERDDGLLELARAHRSAGTPPPKLLGAFDPLLLGWVSRESLLAGNGSVVTRNGLFRPFALVRCRAAATWTLSGGTVELSPFGRLSREDRAALERDGQDVVRFLGVAPATRGGRRRLPAR